jgi:hypothetical protein
MEVPMLTLESIRQALEDRNLRRVSERTGISYSTLMRLRRGKTLSYRHAKQLSDYIKDAVHG